MGFSCFSLPMLSRKEHKAVVLQFVLHELLEAFCAFEKKAPWTTILSPEPQFHPYAWSQMLGHLNKAHEHYCYLTTEECPLRIRNLSTKTLQKTLVLFYRHLEPFIALCSDDASLLFFLLKHETLINKLLKTQGYLRSFLNTLHPEGLEGVAQKMMAGYYERGCFTQLVEIQQLLNL